MSSDAIIASKSGERVNGTSGKRSNVETNCLPGSSRSSTKSVAKQIEDNNPCPKIHAPNPLDSNRATALATAPVLPRQLPRVDLTEERNSSSATMPKRSTSIQSPATRTIDPVEPHSQQQQQQKRSNVANRNMTDSDNEKNCSSLVTRATSQSPLLNTSSGSSLRADATAANAKQTSPPSDDCSEPNTSNSKKSATNS